MMKINEKMLLIVSSVLVIMFGLIAFVIAQEKKKVEVKLLWQKQLDANVKDIAIAEEEVKPGVLKTDLILITDKGVRILDKDGNLKISYEYPSAHYVATYTSENGKYIGMKIYDKHWPEQRKPRFILINHNGEKISEFEMTDNSCQVIISNNGKRIIALGSAYNECQNSYLTFYDNNGNELNHIYNREIGYGHGSFSGDSEYFILSAKFREWDKNKKKWVNWMPMQYLFFFSKNGNELWRKKLKYVGNDVIKISEKGNLIFIAVQTWEREKGKKVFILFYNKNGDLLRELSGSEYECINKILISEKEKIAIIGSMKEKIIYMFNFNGDLLWKKEFLSNANTMIMDIDIDENSHLIAVVEKNSVYLLDFDGDILMKKDFSENISRVKIKNNRLLIRDVHKKIQYYEISK